MLLRLLLPLRFVLALLLLALVLVALVLPPGAAAHAATGTPSTGTAGAGVGIALVDIPAATQDDPRARRYIVDNLAPGTTISRRVRVTNGSDEAQNVQVYAGSARIVEGAFTGDARGSVNDLAQWTSVDQPEVLLDAGAERDVLVTVAVPPDAPEGEQYAAVWAEVTNSTPGENLTSASRAGVRMYVSVAPGNGPAADFAFGALTASRAEDGSGLVTAEVVNTGGRALDLSGQLRLDGGPSGLSAGPFASADVTTLEPGASGQVVVELGPDLPDGPWRAHLTVSSGLLVRDISADVTFPAPGGTSVLAEDEESAIPLAVGLAAALLGAAAAVLLWTRRRGRRARRESRHSAR